MSRKTFLFVICLIVASGIAPASANAADFTAATAASVWGAALSYIAPRSLQQVSVPQMTAWGLNGLTALDPNLQATVQDNEIKLFGPSSQLLALPAPAANDAAAWGRAAAAVAAAAYANSPPLQQAGTQGVIESFFDELFNHFDPYSRYEPPSQAAREQLMITGLAGAGLTFGRDGNNVVIASVAADGPAAEAGLTVGTRVFAVGGKPAFPNDLLNLNAALTGLRGSKLLLHVQDASIGAPGDVTLSRAFVPPQTVFPEPFGNGGAIGLRIESFNEGTSDNFSAALVAAMQAQPNPTGLMIDLRGNRGGVLRQAILVVDSLLPAGNITRTDGRDIAADQSYAAEGSDLTDGLPIVLLVDGQTASAAEIMAAALADNRRAVVVGSETLGKGLVQTLTSLPDGGELYVTWSRVLAPRGWPMQSLGVMPQLCTSLGEQAVGNQLAALKSGRNLMAKAVARARAARAPLPVDQILAVRDSCPAAIGGELDTAAAAAILATPTAYQTALLPH